MTGYLMMIGLHKRNDLMVNFFQKRFLVIGRKGPIVLNIFVGFLHEMPSVFVVSSELW